jgi:curved DNA-binding protein CbpA
MQQELTDLYAILGLRPKATQAQISHAYRTLLRRHHPDTRVTDDQSQVAASDAALQQVLAAYAVLGDAARRTEYDGRTTPNREQRLPQPQPPPRASNPAQRPPIQAGPVHWYRHAETK